MPGSAPAAATLRPVSLPLECGLEQAELALDRVAGPRTGGVRGRVHGGVEAANRDLQRLRALDQAAQTLGQKLDVPLAASLARRELHLCLLLAGLSERHLALLDGAVQEEPRRELHEPRREPHALGGIGKRRRALELLRFLPTGAIEIARGLLHERHAVAKKIGEDL